MKKDLRKVVIVALVTLLIVLPACQQTPEKAIVDNKSTQKQKISVDQDGEIDQTADSSIGDDKISYSVPETWTDSFSKGDVQFSINCEVEIPDQMEPVSTIIVEPQFYDVQAIQNIMNQYLGKYEIDGYISQTEYQMTKGELAEVILSYKENLALLKSDPETWFGDDEYTSEDLEMAIAQYDQNISDAEASYQKAPETVSYKLYTLEEALKSCLLFKIMSGQDVVGSIMISSSQYNDGKSMGLSFFFPPRELDENSNAKPLTVSEADAVIQAQDFIKILGWNKYGISLKERTTNGPGDYYHIVCVKEYSGLLETFAPYATDNTFLDDELYDCEWTPEYIDFNINDDGIRRAVWNAPTKVTEVKDNMLTLLDFSQIQNKFLEHISLQEAWFDPESGIISRNIEITKARLGIMKIKMMSGMYEMVPVWDFFGYSTDKYAEQQPGGYELDENMEYRNPELRSFITINAVDGTVIDRSKGY